jgi:ribonuclease HII
VQLVESIHVGVDENGLGPRLGPLLVTAVTARVEEGAEKHVRQRPRGGAGERLGDSKRLVSFDDSGLGEAWARAIAMRDATSPSALVAALALDDDAALRSPCPSHHAEMCWSAEGETLVSDGALVGAILADLDRLARRGVRVTGARFAIVCAKRLNEGIDRGLSRFDLDLHAMERLVADAAARAGGEVIATCGKVGGYDKYGDAFGRFALHTPIVEGRARSEYRVPGVGTIAFVRDAEDRHVLVAMASLIGKWARDLLMRRIVRYHREQDPDLPSASGYHDPVTTRFIDATSLARKRSRIADECFVRRALGAQG